MKPQYKIVIGALMIVGGIWWYSLNAPMGTQMTNMESLAVMFKGSIGAVFLILGTFIVWIESDEIKIQKELEQSDFEPEDYKTGDEFQETEGEVSIEDVEYEEIVSGTIDKVKESVEKRNLDISKVLKFEKKNKDRKTLKEWLENRK